MDDGIDKMLNWHPSECDQRSCVAGLSKTQTSDQDDRTTEGRPSDRT
jgi:hypothetical protein